MHVSPERFLGTYCYGQSTSSHLQRSITLITSAHQLLNSDKMNFSSVFLFFFVLYSRHVDGACLYNSTHCQCSQGHDVGLCLRYESGNGNTATCLADDCSTVAYKCDCMGSAVCPLQSCTKWKWSTTPTSPTTISQGDRVSCFSEQGVCVGLPTNDIVAPCVHNSTHCQCGPGHDGGLCLRFLSGSSSSASCVVENCLGGGHKCDCMGDGMCALKACGSWNSVTTTTTSPLVLGATVPCSYQDALSQSAGTCATLLP